MLCEEHSSSLARRGRKPLSTMYFNDVYGGPSARAGSFAEFQSVASILEAGEHKR